MKTRHPLPATKAFALGAALCGLLIAAPSFAADAAAAPAAPAAPALPAIDPDAARLLQAASTQLVAAKAYSFKAEIWEDAVIFDHKVTTTKTVEVQVRRPDRLQIEVRSPRHSRGFWYDGKSLTLLNRVDNLYGTIAVPDTIDKLLDAANDKFGVVLPLEDLLVSDPYASAMEGIKGGVYFGKVTILGTPCRHIAFSTDAVDWQVWIGDGPTPMVRKLTITYKREANAPQFTAIFTDWNLSAELPDATFGFAPPKGSAKIEVLPAAPEAE
jgi:hypothetical protein